MSIVERIDSVFQSERIEIEWSKYDSLVVGKYEIKTVPDYIQVIVDNSLYRSFSNITTRLEEHPGRIDVFSPVDIIVSNTGEKKNVITCRVFEGFIQNNFVVKFWKPFGPNLHTVHYIQCCALRYGKADFYFVFDIEDTRKKYADACNELLTHLPPELVIQIAKHLGTTKSDFYYDIEYSEKDFPVNFKPKYKLQSIPEKLTKTQLQKLYKLGVLKVYLFNYYGHIALFTEEAYDEDPYIWKDQFPTKKDFLRKLEDLKFKINWFFRF